MSDKFPFFRRNKKLNLLTLKQMLPAQLPVFDSGIKILDQGFPIREDNAKVDMVAGSRSGELIFIWAKEKLSLEDMVRLLPDYEWIEKNLKMWEHLFPRVKKGNFLILKLWLFCLQIDADVSTALAYLSKVQVRIFHCSSVKKGDDLELVIQPWNREVKTQLQVVPNLTPELPKVSRKSDLQLHLSPEEVRDLIGPTPILDFNLEDEITEPLFDPILLNYQSS